MTTHPLFDVSLETIVTGKDFADLPASPLQIGITRAAEGRATDGVLAADELLRYFGVESLDDVVTAVMPTLVVVVAGVRGGKSFLAACAAIRGCLRADLSRLKPYELPRFAIIAPRVDAATATFQILLGILRTSPILRGLISGDPTSDTVVLRRPDGRCVELVVVAAASGGITVRNRWLVGFVFEEVAQFGAEILGAVVNAEEILRAAETRLLPGGQGWLISSPFGPQGLLHQLWKQYFGRPSRRVLVVHAPTRALNPSFPEEQIEAIRKDAPDVAAREYDAAWVDADTALLSSVHVDAAMRKKAGDLPREPRHFYAGALDPAFRGNGFTLVIVTKEAFPIEEPMVATAGLAGRSPMRFRYVVAVAKQWVGSKANPLSPSGVLEEIASICHAYGIRILESDNFSLDAIRDIARRFGINVYSRPMTAQRKLELFETMRNKLAEGALELPADPVVRDDLLSIRKRVGSSGVTIDLPRTANGRHADFAPALALALDQPIRDPERINELPAAGTREHAAAVQEQIVASIVRQRKAVRESGFWPARRG
jgi:hypothetical protein